MTIVKALKKIAITIVRINKREKKIFPILGGEISYASSEADDYDNEIDEMLEEGDEK
jgi:hypothetical protein